MTRRWVILGAEGQLGREMRARLAGEPVACVGLDYPAVDVRDEAGLCAALADAKPDVVLNLAAFHVVDACEEDPAAAFAVNAIGAWHVARICRALDAKLLHVSTDYVFSGAGRTVPFTESDPPTPCSVYGASKAAGEQLVLAYAPEAIVVRSGGLYGAYTPKAKPYNIAAAFLAAAREGRPLRAVTDQVVSPTWTKPLAEALFRLAASDLHGLVHAACHGACSWYEFASFLVRTAGYDTSVEPIDTARLGAKAARPAYAALDNAVLRAAALDPFPSWQDAIRGFIAEHHCDISS